MICKWQQVSFKTNNWSVFPDCTYCCNSDGISRVWILKLKLMDSLIRFVLSLEGPKFILIFHLYLKIYKFTVGYLDINFLTKTVMYSFDF